MSTTLRLCVSALVLLAGCKGREVTDEASTDHDRAQGMEDRDAAPTDSTEVPGTSTDSGVIAADAESGSAPDATTSPASPSPPEGFVPVLVAAGYAGRTTVSCDDGQTWVADRADDKSVRCFDPTDCDHRADNNTGLVFKDGWFIATFGWGSPGTIRRSQDGKTWITTLMGTEVHGSTFAGLCTGGSLVLAGARVSKVSSDIGASWKDAGDTNFGEIYNVRAGGYVDYDGGRFVLSAADGSARATRVSKDFGKTWQTPSSIPEICGDPTAITGFQKTALMAVSEGVICRSTDGGNTWTTIDLIEGEGGFATKFVVTEKEVMIWAQHPTEGRVLLRSADAKQFTRTKTSGAHLGAVGYNPKTGTFVASNDDWNGWYENQKFYRSKDGIQWQELPKTAFVGSHPIRHFAFGYVPKNTVCQ